MLEFIFTLDYELFGNGTGSLVQHVYEPAQRLLELLEKWEARMVFFVEALEFLRIEEAGFDGASGQIRAQIQAAHAQGMEIGLHLHPQWANASYHDQRWVLDYSEYNLCTLPPQRVSRIVDTALAYFRSVLHQRDYVPCSFRAGNWLFQPTATAARVLQEKGLRLDSSVFKGGVQHAHGLDYRAAPAQAYYWRFRDDVLKAVAEGPLLEVPIYTRLVPSWKMATGKRLRSQRRGQSGPRDPGQRWHRLLDLMRVRYPLKLDFCRMTLGELIATMDALIERDAATPETYKPIVAIGHTKDLVDFQTIDGFFSYLRKREITTTDFRGVIQRLPLEALAAA